MKLIIIILLTFSITSFGQTISDKKKTNERITTLENDCACIDYMFSQSGELPLLTQNIGDAKIIVCGYRGEYGDKIVLGKKLQDSSFYASGFEVFHCTNYELKQIFEDGEYYIDLIKSHSNYFEIIRLMQFPNGKKLNYELTPVLSIKIIEKNNTIKIDSSFVFPYDNYDKDFLDLFESELDRVKNDSVEYIKYNDYLIDYLFIQAIGNPKKYSGKLKSIGPFDGYLGPIYRDILEYYKLFEKENTVGNNVYKK